MELQEIRNSFEQQLIDSGYNFFKDNWGNSLRGIQKKFTNVNGIKYFITGYNYNYLEQYPESNAPKGDSYTFSAQFKVDKNGKDQTVNLNFTGDFLSNDDKLITTISEMERFFKRAYVSFYADYYELYED